MLWHFRANLQQGSENFAAHLWQEELEDVETAQAAHTGKLCKSIMPSSIIIAGTVKILYPLLLRKLFLWDCNHSSLQMKNHQAVRRTLEGQNERRPSGSVHRGCGAERQDQAAGMGLWAVGQPPRLSPVPEGLQPSLCLPTHLLSPARSPAPRCWAAVPCPVHGAWHGRAGDSHCTPHGHSSCHVPTAWENTRAKGDGHTARGN